MKKFMMAVIVLLAGCGESKYIESEKIELPIFKLTQNSLTYTVNTSKLNNTKVLPEFIKVYIVTHKGETQIELYRPVFEEIKVNESIDAFYEYQPDCLHIETSEIISESEFTYSCLKPLKFIDKKLSKKHQSLIESALNIYPTYTIRKKLDSEICKHTDLSSNSLSFHPAYRKGYTHSFSINDYNFEDYVSGEWISPKWCGDAIQYSKEYEDIFVKTVSVLQEIIPIYLKNDKEPDLGGS